MTAALALLAGAVLLSWLGPGFLRRADRRRRDPQALAIAWLMSMAGALLAALAAVVVLLLPDHGPASALARFAHSSWFLVAHGSPPELEALSGLLGAALLAAFAVRLAMVWVRGLRRRNRARGEQLALLRPTARSEPGRSCTLWLPHDRPLAFSMAGRPGVVVATDGLRRHLGSPATAAVLAHERAHLTGRHHLLVASADTLRATLPWVPLFWHGPKAIRELVELAADSTAVAACGTAAVRRALLGMSRCEAPSTALAMGQDAIGLRLSRLDETRRRRGAAHRTLTYCATGTAALLLPFGLGLAMLLAVLLLGHLLGVVSV